jgi:DNA helicase-2/ATP-dependent DNA helicase PcrA
MKLETPYQTTQNPAEAVLAMSDLSKLNEPQREAVTTFEGPVLVLAGAGSGKTRVVTSRIVHLTENGIPPSKILGVTFTNKAAAEMRERVIKMTKNHVLICTFHSLGARILRESISLLGYTNDFTIYDEEDVEKLIRVCLAELGIKDKKLDVKTFRPMISHAKNALQDPDEATLFEVESEVEDAFHKVYPLYQRKLKEYQAVDFDDLLFLPVKLLKNNPALLERYQDRWPFVLIDEYQDTNAAQYTMTKLLVQKRNNLFVVGDPDQSIYSWRGADLQNILNFEKDYPGAKIIRLEQNYRSSSNILDAANALISYNTSRYEKKLWSDKGPGEKIKLFTGEDERAEAEFVSSQIVYHNKHDLINLNEMCIFYRTNAQSRAFEDYLIYKGIPYVIVGGISFYQRREIKDILAFLRMAYSGADFISFARTINLPKRGIGDTTVEKLRQGASLEGMTFLGFIEALVNNQPLTQILRLSAAQKTGLAAYLKIIHHLRDLKEGPIPDLVKAAIEATEYLNYLMEDKETYAERRENLDELITKAVEWEMSAPNPSLSSFLEELSLKSSLDEADQTQERLSLMTLHNGKGLEFKVTFLVGLEEDLFPHVNSRDSGAALEEERRLCYVGITRAKEYLYLSHCHTRYLWGTLRMQRPSRFLKELPMEYLEKFKQKHLRFQPGALERPEKAKVSYTPKVIPASQEEFGPGDTIFHKDFGIGEVREAYQGSLGLSYKIFFTKDNTLKTLVAKYAVLSRI